jgi:hypothetical protein
MWFRAGAALAHVRHEIRPGDHRDSFAGFAGANLHFGQVRPYVQ